MDITRDIAQLQDEQIRARMERDAPRTVDAAFSTLAGLLVMQYGPVALENGALTINVDGTPISIRVGDHCAIVGMATEPGGRLAEARVRSLPALEGLFADSLAAARRVRESQPA